MNCKPGDLAFIVASDFPKNVGKVVEVIRRCPEVEWTHHLYPEWECRSRTPLDGVVVTFPWGDQELDPMMCDVPDSDLRPIGSFPVTDEITEDLKEPA